MSTATAVKERPIKLDLHEVEPILDGSKTMLRRIVTPQPYRDDRGYWCKATRNGSESLVHETVDYKDGKEVSSRREEIGPPECIYRLWKQPAKVGDLLWCKETFYIDVLPWADGGPLPPEGTEHLCESLYYRADGSCCEQIPECMCAEVGKPRWRPSTHMPRWASRITLQVTGVRAEQIQQITPKDCKAEGLRYTSEGWGPLGRAGSVSGFQDLWESLNGESSWYKNPWVWVIEFSRI